MARYYSNTSLETTLSFGINNSTTSITVGSATGLPASFPYSLIIDYEQSTVEVVSVTAAAGTTLTVVRGQDGTSAQTHASGAVVVHGATARDLREPQEHMDASGNIHGVGVSASVVGTDTSQTLTNKNISGLTNTLTSLPAAQLTGTWAAGTITALAVATLNASSNVTVGGTLGVTGATTVTSLAASGNATVGGTLGVTGATTAAGITASGQIRSTRSLGSENSFYADITGDTQPRLIVQGDGDIYWGPGNAGIDTRLYRPSASLLKTDAGFEAVGAVTIGGAASVGGNLTVTGRIDNQRIRARGQRTTNTAYSASSTDVDVYRFDDVPVVAGHTYRLDATSVHVDATAANNAIVIRWKYTTDGSTPTSASTVLNEFKTDVIQTTNIPCYSFTTYYHPATSHNFSVTMSFARGFGAGSVRLIPLTTTGYMEFVLTDEGITPALSGTTL